GILTLAGTDTLAHYRDALRSVTYSNTSEAPDTSDRTITFIATDGTTPSAAKTKTVSVTAVNDAPVLSGANNFAAIDEDNKTSAATKVADLISGKVTDPDGSGALQGIAITATDTDNGSWEYTVDGGSSWKAVGSVSNGSALLLTDDSNTRVRFVPADNFNGTV